VTWSSGASTETQFNVAPGISELIDNFSDPNESGTETQRTTIYSTGDYQVSLLNDWLPTGDKSFTEQFNGSTREMTSATIVDDMGYSETFSYNYAQGALQNYSVTLYNSEGASIAELPFNANGGADVGFVNVPVEFFAFGYTNNVNYAGRLDAGYLGGGQYTNNPTGLDVGYDDIYGLGAGPDAPGADDSHTALDSLGIGDLTLGDLGYGDLTSGDVFGNLGSGGWSGFFDNTADVTMIAGNGFAGSQSVVDSALAGSVGSVAQHDIDVGNLAGAVVAEAAFRQAQQTAETAPTSDTGQAVDSGAKWGAGAISWSFTNTQDNQYDAFAQQAFSEWASASGLTFAEIANSSQADIQISFGDLGSPTSGVVGYTTNATYNGAISSALIQLENPSEDALVKTAGGALMYASTDATLEQVLLHEIGHALGLADDADQSSVMYYELTSSNRTLDDTDVNGIQSLYGGSTARAVSHALDTIDDSNLTSVIRTSDASSANLSNIQLDSLIAGMAAFSAVGSAGAMQPFTPSGSEIMLAAQQLR
jgi:predicted Zn-dependent protease